MLDITVEASNLEAALTEGDARAKAFFGDTPHSLTHMRASEAGYVQTADARQRRSTFSVFLTYDVK